MFNSLRSALLLWLLVPLIAVGLFNVWTTYRSALELADLRSDQNLLASARTIAEDLQVSDGQTEAPIPPAALELFASGTPDKVVYRVSTKAGTLLAGNPDLALPPQQLLSLSPRFFDTYLHGAGMRAVALAQPVYSAGQEDLINVLVAQTRAGHDQMVSGLWLKALRDQGLIVAAAAILALYGLSRGLRPLQGLGRQLERRDARNISPLEGVQIQTELLPLVNAINGALGKVETQLASQRRFIANAAHQLRTPLALLRTQAQVGRRTSGEKKKDEALRAIEASTVAMSRLVTQLLSLARAEQGPSLLRKEQLDLTTLVRAAVEDHLPRSFERNQDLGFEGRKDALLVFGHSGLLREMVSNVIDNALRYSPPHSTVTVNLSSTEGSAEIVVEDDGPGMTNDKIGKAFERFERGTESEGGTGLGLAIVDEIVRAHGGSVRLQPRAPQPGLAVKITLPLAGDQATSAEV